MSTKSNFDIKDVCCVVLCVAAIVVIYKVMFKSGYINTAYGVTNNLRTRGPVDYQSDIARNPHLLANPTSKWVPMGYPGLYTDFEADERKVLNGTLLKQYENIGPMYAPYFQPDEKAIHQAIQTGEYALAQKVAAVNTRFDDGLLKDPFLRRPAWSAV